MLGILGKFGLSWKKKIPQDHLRTTSKTSATHLRLVYDYLKMLTRLLLRDHFVTIWVCIVDIVTFVDTGIGGGSRP